MKTFEQVSEKAMQIADSDPSARVAVFDLRVRQKAQCVEPVRRGLFKHTTLQYVSESGGVVKFYDAGSEVWPLVAGSQFTHVFCSEYVSSQDKKLIASRIRYKQRPSPEPAGFYDFNGVVTRTEIW
jgi:hypothetical protein